MVTYWKLHERSNKTASFAEHMRFKKKIDFQICTVSQNLQIKTREMEPRHFLHIENAVYRVLHERSN